MKNKPQNNFETLFIVTVIVVVVVAGYSMLSKKGAEKTTNTEDQSYSAIQNDSDLGKASGELDSVNVNQMDAEINQLNSDSSF